MGEDISDGEVWCLLSMLPDGEVELVADLRGCGVLTIGAPVLVFLHLPQVHDVA